MNHVVRSLNVDTKTHSNSGKDDHGKSRLLLELINELLPTLGALAAGAGIAIDNGGLETEALMNGMLNLTLNIAQLAEHDHFVAFARALNTFERL